jgi:hypothetical protein
VSIEHDSIDEPSAPAPANGWPLQVAVFGLFSILLLLCLIGSRLYPLSMADNPAVEPPRIALIEQRIDPNLADWQELTRLPGIGETLGKRIVEYRGEILADGGRKPVFTQPEDLDPIRGIGPVRLRRLADYLKFPERQPRRQR